MSNDSGPVFASAENNDALEEGLQFTPRFDGNGLIPAIVTDGETGKVLMFAWMNAHALALTLKTGNAHFWSRSRKKLWMKGEESGNVLSVQNITTDCDQDVLCLQVAVKGDGLACHTKRTTCFYRTIQIDPTDPTRSKLRISDDPA